MSKRKFEDDAEDFEIDWKDKEIRPDIKKNSLDSDEEDEIDEKKYTILHDDDIEGQEDGIGRFDGETTITPFNMKEELEEGHFDKEGTYHWKKEGKQIRDHWLDNIEWVKIKNKDGTENTETNEDSDSDDSMPSPFDHISVYKEILPFLKPGEIIAKAIRRLGGNKTISASERWKRKKAGLDSGVTEDQQKVTKLTELANTLLTETGNMDIYQESYEYISEMIRKSEKPQPKNMDNALDMYADDFDEKEKARIQGEKKDCTSEVNEPESQNEVKWEFKWKEDSEDVQGPHTTQQMQAWVEEGYFKSNVWVRKCGQDGPFYNSKRVDFELYM